MIKIKLTHKKTFSAQWSEGVKNFSPIKIQIILNLLKYQKWWFIPFIQYGIYQYDK